MSRKVASTGLVVLPNGTTALLSVPAGKKYELLETCYYGTAAAAGPVTYDIDYDGTNALITNEHQALAAGLFVARASYVNHLLDAGDSFYVTVLNTTAGVVCRVTYVDVDL